MIPRKAQNKFVELANSFKTVAVIGPRQSGKTTLLKSIFKSKPYVSLENFDNRNFALNDPRGFLSTYQNGAIFDEIQRTPELFSYIQEIVDNSSTKGLYIFSGSNNFLLNQSISQSLAGRISYLTLLPFSLAELTNYNIDSISDNELIIKGFYPPIYDQQIEPSDWCNNYIRTYIERDVRQIKNISDLIIFERFLSLLAGRCSQELNMTSLSVETGVDVKTIQSWIGILEASYIIYLLKSHHKNFNKTIVKRPKVYFYDTALVCSLLGIRTKEHLSTHPLRGALFESMVISEMVKRRTNSGLPVNLYYWRDKTGHEIDVIIDNAGKLTAIEIKSGKTINSEFFKNIDYWSKLSNIKNSYLLYAGNDMQKRSNGSSVLCWRDFEKVFDEIE